MAAYNEQHRHSGIGLMAPATVHYGRAEAVHADRAKVLDAAYIANPERFVDNQERQRIIPLARTHRAQAQNKPSNTTDMRGRS